MNLTLTVLADAYSVVQYPPATILAPPAQAALWSMSVAAHENSLVCRTADVPGGALKQEDGWRALRLAGPFDFALTGILASVAVPLAQADIGILALSTYDTDYVLVKAAQLEAAIAALRNAGHQVLMHN